MKVLDDLVDTEVGETVRTEEQNLSEEQKKIARENIGGYTFIMHENQDYNYDVTPTIDKNEVVFYYS